MAEETLVKEALTPEMIEAGKSVLENLDRKGLVAEAALWLYLPETNRWRLVIATPEERLQGPRKIYRRVLDALTESDAGALSLQDVSVVDTRDPFIQALRSAIKTRRPGSPIRFSKNTVKGQYIEDALIYRMAA